MADGKINILQTCDGPARPCSRRRGASRVAGFCRMRRLGEAINGCAIDNGDMRGSARVDRAANGHGCCARRVRQRRRRARRRRRATWQMGRTSLSGPPRSRPDTRAPRQRLRCVPDSHRCCSPSPPPIPLSSSPSSSPPSSPSTSPSSSKLPSPSSPALAGHPLVVYFYLKPYIPAACPSH